MDARIGDEAILRLAGHVAAALTNSRMFTSEALAREVAQTSGQRFRDLLDSLDATRALLAPRSRRPRTP